MGSATLEVPAEYTETLRLAVLAEVTQQSKFTQIEVDSVCEARYRRREDQVIEAREADLAGSQRLLAESAVFVDQVPPPGAEATAKLEGDREALDALIDQGTRFCVKALTELMGYAPIEAEDVRGRMGELDFWVSQIEVRSSNGSAV